ncbi:hypothetical protein [Streptomyces erythrochromogenes]|uniref:hypothetical protein n=1 Tax=Streptomyces erythrochromogenes TaxID=285574 RepID=UPI0038664990|nr:hypothetical protein OG364_00280 [Streptomyces erythrochromogenes]WST99031.1 hypothetical protein OG364_41255 [Streptomyces erythrochromogenes]
MTTVVGALLATMGVLVGGVVARRAQDRQWLRDQQLAAYRNLFEHYAKFTMELRRAHGDQRGWDYDWGEWSAALMRVSLVAPLEVATALDEFGRAINSFLDHVERGERNPLRNPMSSEEFERARQVPALAQVSLVNAIRRSLSSEKGDLPFGIGG